MFQCLPGQVVRRGTLATLGTALLTACVSQVAYAPMAGSPSPAEGLEATVYLVGDAGEDSPGRDAVLAHLRDDLTRQAREHGGVPTLVSFLGDNIYDVGARPEFKAEDLAKLTAQVDAVRGTPHAQAVFLPGNHDWAKGASDPSARESIRVQQVWLSEVAPDSTASFLPSDGCPGPTPVAVGADVHVLFVDTEWLLRTPDDDCGGADAFYDRLRSELSRRAGERVIVAAHHPMATGGPHGGNTAGFSRGPGIEYLAIKAGLSVQDLASGRYSTMLDELRSAIAASGARPLVFAAGHDHSLQVIGLEGTDVPVYQLVSGSASKQSPVGRVTGTRYASAAHGYMRLDFTASATRVVVFAQSEGEGPIRPVFSCTLSQGDVIAPCPEARLLPGDS